MKRFTLECDLIEYNRDHDIMAAHSNGVPMVCMKQLRELVRLPKDEKIDKLFFTVFDEFEEGTIRISKNKDYFDWNFCGVHVEDLGVTRLFYRVLELLNEKFGNNHELFILVEYKEK